jgi:3-methyl-2-oxobutanoate hydroxymethyltransferase
VKKYANLSPLILQAINEYKQEVVQGKFPAKEHTFSIKEDEMGKLKERQEG